MKKILWQALYALAVIMIITACTPDENPKPKELTPVLPPPQVWITSIPATPTATPDLLVAIEGTPTVLTSEPIQPLPTVDIEQSLYDEIDWYKNKIYDALRSADTNIKP